MKIAISTDGSRVAQYFGRCPEYTVYSIEERTVVAKTVIPNPGHEPGFLPEYLSNLGVSCIIAGGMGVRAQNLFAQKNIQTVLGATGLVDDVAKSFASGGLTGGKSLCDHGHGQSPHSGCEDHHNH